MVCVIKVLHTVDIKYPKSTCIILLFILFAHHALHLCYRLDSYLPSICSLIQSLVEIAAYYGKMAAENRQVSYDLAAAAFIKLLLSLPTSYPNSQFVFST